jgi:hypothetical protein
MRPHFLEAWNTMEQRMDALLPNVAWERVDGEHI